MTRLALGGNVFSIFTSEFILVVFFLDQDLNDFLVAAI